MDILPMQNPFGAPVYYKKTVTSTMDEARLLSEQTSGAVIVADEQSAGRGRSGRSWKMNSGENLSFTIKLHYPCIEEFPPALTLRTGLAVAHAIEDFAAGILKLPLSQPAEPPPAGLPPTKPTPAGLLPFAGNVLVKWPNDVMLLDKDRRGRKAAGILTEADNNNVYIGIGVNIAQNNFPQELAEKACSILQIITSYCYNDMKTGQQQLSEQFKKELQELLLEKRFILLEKTLSCLFNELHNTVALSDWKQRLEARLYMKGQKVCFVPGLPEELSNDPVPVVEGTLLGVGDNGEIRIVDDVGEIHSFVTGEICIIPAAHSLTQRRTG